MFVFSTRSSHQPLSPTSSWPRQPLFYDWRAQARQLLVHHSNSVSKSLDVTLFCPPGLNVEMLQSHGLPLLPLIDHPLSLFLPFSSLHIMLTSSFQGLPSFLQRACQRHAAHLISSHLSNKLLTSIIPEFNSQPVLKLFNTPTVMKSRSWHCWVVWVMGSWGACHSIATASTMALGYLLSISLPHM